MKKTLIAASVLLAGCGNDAELERLAGVLNSAAEACVWTVRDSRTPYEMAPACRKLDALAEEYIRAGGGRNDEPTKHNLLFAQARLHAWMALAISNARYREKSERIW